MTFISSGDRLDSPVLSVTALNQAVARILERNFPLLWVSGEISNFKCYASGHWYFTLKDDAAQVRAVMFKGRAQHADFTPRDGDQVEVRTLVTLYAPRGDYQLNVETIRRAGTGNLYQTFLRLKEKLHTEGLFDPIRKRPLPSFITCVGIITSPQAAALRDILTTLARRTPHVQVILYPTPVQGDGAAEKIAHAIHTASIRAECQILLVCRGGGSIEDLWSFNDENVARAIVAASMPVIAGIGHETDFTIADFAADLRAATPTAAAELAAIARNHWLTLLAKHATHLTSAWHRQLNQTTQTLDWLAHRLIRPTTAHGRLTLHNLHTRLTHATHISRTQCRYAFINLRARLSNYIPNTSRQRSRLLEQERRLTAAFIMRNQHSRQMLNTLASQLELLHPQRTLDRGYAIVTDAKGQVIRTPKALQPRHFITLQLAQGNARIGISNVQETLEK